MLNKRYTKRYFNYTASVTLITMWCLSTGASWCFLTEVIPQPHPRARAHRRTEPRTQCTEPRAAPSLSRAYIRWRFSRRELCRHRASKERLLRENHKDVSARNLWRSYTDRQKVRWRTPNISSFHPKGKLFYSILLYFILNCFQCFAVFACFDRRVCLTNYAAFVSMLQVGSISSSRRRHR